MAQKASPAESDLRRRIASAPRVAENYLRLSRLLERQQKVDDALSVLRSGLSHMPESIALNEEIGLLYAGQKRYSLAAEHFEEALAGNPASENLRHNLGAARFRLGVEAFEKQDMNAEAKLVTTYSIFHGDKVIAQIRDQEGSSAIYTTEHRVVMARRIGLRNLAPGSYRIAVDVHDAITGQTASVESPFEVITP